MLLLLKCMKESSNMCYSSVLAIISLFSLLTFSVMAHQKDLVIVSREEWGARPPKAIEEMKNPVPYVVIHHSYMPAACYSTEQCVAAMHWMQDFHQDNRSWNDIGYSFAAGGDGKIYEGRGWSRVGAHAPKYNDKSTGICIIGDWREKLPPNNQLTAVKMLIEKGISEGKISKNYQLIGHRQVRDTECPGDALFQEISTWPHFVKDVKDPPKEVLLEKENEDDIVSTRLRKRLV